MDMRRKSSFEANFVAGLPNKCYREQATVILKDYIGVCALLLMWPSAQVAYASSLYV
jgi:hypothetical protein